VVYVFPDFLKIELFFVEASMKKEKKYKRKFVTVSYSIFMYLSD